jgi:hypothetical protein
VKQIRFAFRHHVLVGAETRQPFIDEVAEPTERAGTTDRQPEVRRASGIFGELARDHCHYLPRDLVGFFALRSARVWSAASFPRAVGLAIVGIEIPGAASRLAVRFHQPAETLPHASVVVLHHEPALT